MKLIVKDMDIATGGVQVVILNQKDAEKFDLHALDRVCVRKGRTRTIAIVDIGESEKAVPVGRIGLFEEVLDALNAKNRDVVDIILTRKPNSVQYILKKLNGKALSEKETNEIVKDVVNKNLSNVELTYYVAGCYTKGMSMKEVVDLTKSMVKYGDRLKFKKKPVLDKHCSGGIPGNRTTMLLVPIIAAAGFVIPKTSSRSITSPAGTADTMEFLAPVDLPVDKIKKVVEKTNGCIVWGGSIGLASPDDEMINVRNPLSLDPEGMLLSSIMSKKAAVGATHVLVDLPVGKKTKIKTEKKARSLRAKFSELGEKIGIKVHTIITDGKQPIGNGIGPALEARDVLWVLKRSKKKPLDLEKKALYMAGLLLKIAGVKKADKKAYEILDSGFAYNKMKDIIREQGGNPNIEPDKIKLGKFKYDFKAKKSGKIIDLDNSALSKIARVAGAPKDKEAGIYLYKHEKDRVKKGEKILTIYAESMTNLKYAKEILSAFDGVKIR